MYKNANASFHHMKSTKVVQQQHAITLARINQAAARIGKMVHVFTPPNVEVVDIVIPTAELLVDPLAPHPATHSSVTTSSTTIKSNKIDQYDQHSPSLISNLSPGLNEEKSIMTKSSLNMEKIEKIMAKVSDAEITSIPD